MKGVDFTATDPSQGDASLSIASLTASHAGTYQCKVKKAPGVDSRKISLIVMGNVTSDSFYNINLILQRERKIFSVNVRGSLATM